MRGWRERWSERRSGALAARALALGMAATALLVRGTQAQDVPMLGYSVDPMGRAVIRVASGPDDYFVLFVRHELPDGPEEAVTMALGQAGTTSLTEGLAAYPIDHYRVARYSRAFPGDLDGDGIDDVEEYLHQGRMAPLNAAGEIAIRNGSVAIPDRQTFEALSYQGADVRIDQHLEDLEFVKFYLLDMDTDSPKVYFMNTETHRAHNDFARAVGIANGGRPGGDAVGTRRGEIVYHPHVVAPSGALGVYRFEFEPNDRYAFEAVRESYELLARNMPFLENNWTYYPMPNAALPRYHREKALYDASRVAVLLDDDIFGEVSYLPLNLAEGYGLLSVMGVAERPNPRDVVIYEALPNELSRVAGIITTVPQTPLSHVNLRAIQDGVPNAYIKGALHDPVISSLVGKHVFYRVEADSYAIREATLAEVEAHQASRRPATSQVPVRELRATRIASLDDLRFGDWVGYGVKAANLATLRTFGFPAGTVPDGFAVPFYYYDEFMKHNGFYDEVQALLADPRFLGDYDVQAAELDELRHDIEDADMPQWMLDDLAEMQASFAPGTPIRCRSSTNNEDLPGFSGAGLYDSFTHNPDEGHIAKTIRQVYASLWTYRAFDERQFYRIDHFATAMGVLAHENYRGEKANGVGVTTDPFYRTDGTYYLNTQVGEDLVTNPDPLSIPEEILLGATEGSGYRIVRRSNLVADGVQILAGPHLEQMRRYLGVIDREFRLLYGVGSSESFAMEIEYKITAEGILSLKQARPWHFDEAVQYLRVTPDRLSVSNQAGRATLNVFASASWAATAADEWLAMEPATGTGDGSIIVSYRANDGAADRTGTLTLTAGTLVKTVTVTQAGTVVAGPTVTPTPSARASATLTATAREGPTATLYLPHLIRP